MAARMEASVVNGRKFDRFPNWDPRNENFRLKDIHAETAAKTPPATVSHKRVIWLDQGDEGGCTGYSDAQCMSMYPHNHPEISNPNAEYFYFEAKQYDEYAGDNYEGSSVLGAQKANVANKYTASYSWAATVEEMIQGLAFHGPMQIGINWYESMFTADPKTGIVTIAAGSKVAGGHALCVAGYKDDGNLLRLDNTWGKTWALEGSCWLSAVDMTRLLAEQGEAALPIKEKVLPSPLGTHARVDPGT